MGGEKRPIVCLSTVDWNFLYQRHQQLMSRLARAGHPVHYRNPTQVPGRAPEEVEERLRVYPDFDRLPRRCLEDALYFVYFPAYAAWLGPEAKFVVYDCTDDFPAFDADEDRMLGRADLVICCSEPLYAKFRGRHPRLLLLPNGVDAERFRDAAPAPEIEALRRSGETVAGFSGAAYPQRVDIGLLRRLAELRPAWRIAVVGEPYGQDTPDTPENLSFLGSKPYADLPAYLRGFDVGLIPFHDNRIARGTDPIKLYEYLAAGLPVVSRNLPFVRDLGPPLVYTYDAPGECLDAIERALAEDGEEARRLRQAHAVKHSWDDRVRRLLDALRDLTWLED
ncbi:MAG: glycosyltransferase [Bacteroidota bacterium]